MTAAVATGGTGSSPARARITLLLFAYIVCILYSTLLPFRFTTGNGGASVLGLTLGRDARQGRPAPVGDFLGNVALFLPLGALGYCVQSPSRRRSRWGAIGPAAGMGLLLSLGVETLQRFTPARDPSISDVIANTAGSLLGAAAAARWQGRLRSSALGRLAAEGGEDAWVLALVGMTLVVLLASLVPFDVSPDRVLLRRALRVACLDPRNDPARWGQLAQGTLLHALLAGVVVRLVRRRVRPVPSILCSLGFTLAFSVFIESLQVFVKSQVVATLDVCAALAGGAAGTVLGIGLPRMRRYAWHAVVSGYAVGLLCLRLHWWGVGGGTDLIETRLAALVPIYGRYFRSNLAGITGFVNLVLLFAPLGFLFALRRPLRLRPGGQGIVWQGGIVSIACGGWMVLADLLRVLGSRGEPRFLDAIPAVLGGLVGTAAWRWGDSAVNPRAEWRAHGPADCIRRRGSSAAAALAAGAPAAVSGPGSRPCSAVDAQAARRRELPGAT